MRRTRFIYPVTSLAGSSPGNIIKLLKLHGIEGKYYFKISLTFLVAMILSPFTWLEKLLWGKRIRKFQLQEPPVFIIGFNRSGTTCLHNLLCQDPKAGYTTTFQAVFPHCVLSQKWWLGPLTNMFLPSKRPFDNVSMDMDFPQEEEFALSNMQPFSIYNFFLFPRRFDRLLEKDYPTDSLPARDLRNWKTAYRDLVVKSMIATKGDRYTSKNPQNIPRMKILAEMFPGARFIFIHRDPYVVVESFYQFICAIFPGVQLQDVPDGFSRENVARFYATAMNKYEKMKNNAASGSILELRMEDFLKDKIGGVRKVYETFGIQGFEEAVPHLEAFMAANPDIHHETGIIHDDTVLYVNKYASCIVGKFGYPMRYSSVHPLT